ncbi:MAG: hypothetical protein JXR97_06090 [Planctomycetes bacterium]|nr:hypothetical protein [Planctomycetota bacterium]
MPITLSCACGKTFNVKDELEGQRVKCQICQSVLTVTRQEDEALTPLSGALGEHQEQLPDAETGEDSRECPFCAEIIKQKARKCRHCGESLEEYIDATDVAMYKAEALVALDDHLASHEAQEEDLKLIGGLLSGTTIFCLVGMCLSLLSVLIGAIISSDAGEGALVLGIIFGIIFTIAFLATLSSDWGASNIMNSTKPEKACQRWFNALKTNRTAKAYAAIAPLGRSADEIRSVQFTTIKAHDGAYSFSDVKSYRKYWKSIFGGPSGQQRGVALGKIKIDQKFDDGSVLMNLELKYTSFPTVMLAILPFALLPVAILITVVQKRETQNIKKLMIQRNGKWYIMEGQYQGLLDHAAA